MTTFPGSPRVIRGGLVLLDLDSGAVQRVITLQYNSDSLTRSLQAQAVESPDRSEPLRLKGPPIETIKLDAEIDAADQLELAHDPTVRLGLFPQLAALETIVYPTSGQLLANNRQQQAGTLEILPTQAPLTLFVWSKTRVVPVRITEFSITEEAFDQQLNPIRAKVSLGLRVLSVTDLGFNNKGGGVYMTYQQQKERLAQLYTSAGLSSLGLGGIP